MIELVFRITQEQLDCLGRQLAAKAPEEVLVGVCGSGGATFPSGVRRESWSFRSITNTINYKSVSDYSFHAEKKYCIFHDDAAQLASIAYKHSNCLWACITNGELKVFRYQGELCLIDVSVVVGHNLCYTFGKQNPNLRNNQLYERTAQAFGDGTTKYLSNLTVGIAGTSGTGSIVAEQLYRLGVKRLILVDDDYVEHRNLGRILNSTVTDAENQVNKAIMLKRTYDRIGMDVDVIAAPTVIANIETIRLLSQCDLLFGCLDSADGRMHLNRISTFYTIPYIDLGVKLKSNTGTISEISGAIRYMIPGAASLWSIGAYTTEQVTSEALRREDPIAYRERLKEKYIEGAHEESPAVISVNMLVASLAVLELLNRIHAYRDTLNQETEVLSVDLIEPAFLAPTPPGARDIGLAKALGKGDCVPMLDMPFIGE